MSVIPGRALRASPESITPVFALSVQTLAQGVWIPGLRQVAHPGMTKGPSVIAARKSLRVNGVSENLPQSEEREAERRKAHLG
jgi:hypothetical protein